MRIKEINEKSKGLYYNVNKRKKAGTSRDADHPDAPSSQDWKNAAKTAKKEAIVSEAVPTTFIPTHYGGPGGGNMIMHAPDGNLYFQKPKTGRDGMAVGGKEIVRWNGNPSGEGFFGKWNPATIKGIVKGGRKISYRQGENFKNAPSNQVGKAPAQSWKNPDAKPAGKAGTSNLLRKGSRGAEVKAIQAQLGITADGIFGSGTEKAVMDFQKSAILKGKPLKVDGIVGPNTRAALKLAKVKPKARPTAKATQVDPDGTKAYVDQAPDAKQLGLVKPRDLDAIDAEREKQAQKGITDPAARRAAGLAEPNPNRPKGSTAPSRLRLRQRVLPDVDSWLSKYGS
jgi:peptidoglycan hydrolase-like protein with peptidoglycan-binding domain